MTSIDILTKEVLLLKMLLSVQMNIQWIIQLILDQIQVKDIIIISLITWKCSNLEQEIKHSKRRIWNQNQHKNITNP